jgi:hypothetical protein
MKSEHRDAALEQIERSAAASSATPVSMFACDTTPARSCDASDKPCA